MKHTLIVEGGFPSLNEFISACRTHPIKGNQMKRKSQNQIAFHIIQQLHGVHVHAPVILHYRYFEKNRKRDIDNVHSYFSKVLQDSLVECKILENDSQRYIHGFTAEFECDPQKPRIEIEIEEVDNGNIGKRVKELKG